MVDPNVYRKAAELIANSETRYACLAIGRANSYQYSYPSPSELFINMFSPEDGTRYWWGFQTSEKSQMARSLALLFMAEIASENENIKK